MRRTATKFYSNSAVAVVKAEATRGSATCAYDTSHLVHSTLIASTLLLQSSIQALQRLVRARQVVVLMRCSVVSKPSETRTHRWKRRAHSRFPMP